MLMYLMQVSSTFGFPKMVLSRALDNDNQAFRRPWGLINRKFKQNILAFESQIYVLLNGYFK